VGGQEIVLILPLLWIWFTGTLLVIYVAGQKLASPGLGPPLVVHRWPAVRVDRPRCGAQPRRR
jgi:hypothetical protein